MREVGFGSRVPRSEDIRLVQGLGGFTDDLAFQHQAYLFVLRSPYPFAFIRGDIRTDEAAAMAGVLAVLTGRDAIAEGLGNIPSGVKRSAPNGNSNFEPPYRALAVDMVRHVGDAVVAIVATSLSIAKDAAELVEIDYEPRPSVTITALAAEADAPSVWPEVPDNICFLHEVGNEAEVAAAFSSADHVTQLDFTISRISANPMEPRNAIGQFDAGTGRYTLFAGMQDPHTVRFELTRMLGIPENMLRVVSPDCGGAFGLKQGVFPEYILALWAAKRTGRTVRWQCERAEAFLADHHARDNVSRVELALNSHGHFLALQVHTTANLGAYLDAYGNHSPTNNLGGLAGTYLTPHIHASSSVCSPTPTPPPLIEVRAGPKHPMRSSG